MATIIITNIVKNAQILTCKTDDPKGREYKIDFQKGEIYGINGKTIQSTSTITDKIPENLKRTNPLYYALKAISSTSIHDLRYWSVIESLLSYPDLLDGNVHFYNFYQALSSKYNNKLPKGYVTYLRENSLKFSAKTLEDFKMDQIRKQWPPALFENAQKFIKGTGCNIISETNYDKELCASMLRIINNSLKRYEIKDLLYNVKSIIRTITIHPLTRSYLDDTKSAESAYKILLKAYDKERNKIILEKEEQILSLNGKVIDDVTIKIPTAIEDFTDEGNQQHNCVGHFYHDSIASGNTLIYFLRKTDSPDKSYITCRFDVAANNTVEHRIRNNAWYEDSEKIIERVDNMIRDILRK